jgi:RNA-binding protein Musashi
MRDSATGRSRGFGFLTFKDPKTVNTVMVKEHYLDGKIVRRIFCLFCRMHQKRSKQIDRMLTRWQIDPKRAIPRDEQEKTSKIFVGGVSQEATEQEFKEFFTQFGRVIDATLMIDKDTGRPRGFGFVTFDSEAAVEAALSRPLAICGKPIEVKKAQPRGNLRDEEDRRNRRGRDFRDGGHGGVDGSQQQQGMQGQAGMPAGLTPQMMAQYWQRMQQYFALMQQQMAVAAAQGQGMGAMGMGAMNPAMMQQMQQMQKMQQMQMANNQQQQPQQQGSLSPPSQSPTPQMQNMMNPAMMQQMQNQVQGNNMGAMQGQMGNNAGNMNMGANYPGARGGPGYNAQEQLAFEQQKYEQQQQQRRVMESRAFSPYQQGGPTSWEGMYDEVPQPNIPTGPQGMNRAGSIGRGTYSFCLVTCITPINERLYPLHIANFKLQEQPHSQLRAPRLPTPQRARKMQESPVRTIVAEVAEAIGVSILTLVDRVGARDHCRFLLALSPSFLFHLSDIWLQFSVVLLFPFVPYFPVLA